MGCYKHPSYVFRDLLHIMNTAVSSYLSHKLIRIKSTLNNYFFKIRMYFRQFIIIHYIPHEGYGKQGLYPAGSTADNAYGACRSYGCGGGIPELFAFTVFICTLIIIGENTSCPGQLF